MSRPMSQARIAMPLHVYRLQPGDGTEYHFGIGFFSKVLSKDYTMYDPETGEIDTSLQNNPPKGDIRDVISGLGPIPNDFILLQIYGSSAQASYEVRKSALSLKDDALLAITADYYKGHTNYPHIYTVVAVCLAASWLIGHPLDLSGACKAMKRTQEILVKHLIERD